MSNFNCEHCGAPCIDSDRGYVAGCEHYAADVPSASKDDSEHTNESSTDTPRRIQRKRIKGWRLPANTVCVTRPGPWGNPFDTASEFNEAVECCSELRHVPEWMDFEKGQRILWMIEHMDELKGKNLACYCPPDKRCHADMLLIWANC